VPLQDLTPQLRTRLSRLERVVGVFIGLAALLLLAGLAFYIHQRAKTKGWFDLKLPYFTFVRSGAGLKVGDPIKLMGFDVGEITEITPQPPGSYFDVFVAFRVKEPNFGYLWEDSRAKIGTSDFLGKRFIELSKGTNGPATYLFHPIKEVPLTDAPNLLPGNQQFFFAEEIYDQYKTNLIVAANARFDENALRKITEARSVVSIRLFDRAARSKQPTGLWDSQDARYRPPNENAETRKGYFLVPDEAPALNERLEKVAAQAERMVALVESALPNVLGLTNQLQRVLDNAATTTARADELLVNVRPIVANLTRISENISKPDGSLGEWLIPPNLSLQLTQALASANRLLTNSDTQLTTVATSLDATIDNLAKITGNLHDQVRANTNLVSEVSRLIIDTDDMVQGLKRHWLLRSAFKNTGPQSPKAPAQRPPARSPRNAGR
jgi:ABC-type transporter Mla subunit MlaD